MLSSIRHTVTFLALAFCLLAGKVSANTLTGADTAIYPVIIAADLDKIADYEFTVKLNKTAQVHILSFPAFGTQTGVSIYGKEFDIVTPLYDIDFPLSQGWGLMDVSNIQPGRYTVWLTACHNGGYFTLLVE